MMVSLAVCNFVRLLPCTCFPVLPVDSRKRTRSAEPNLQLTPAASDQQIVRGLHKHGSALQTASCQALKVQRPDMVALVENWSDKRRDERALGF